MNDPRPALRRWPKKAKSRLFEVVKASMLMGFFAGVLGVGFVVNRNMSDRLEEKKSQRGRLSQEWGKVKHWVGKKQEYEILTWLLGKKRQIIGELESERDLPAMLLQDLANDLPEAVRLGSVTQGFTADQVAAMTGTQGVMQFLEASEAGRVQVRGFGQSIESITRYGNRILANPRYWRLEMKNFKWQKETSEYSFQISFRVRLNRF